MSIKIIEFTDSLVNYLAGQQCEFVGQLQLCFLNKEIYGSQGCRLFLYLTWDCEYCRPAESTNCTALE